MSPKQEAAKGASEYTLKVQSEPWHEGWRARVDGGIWHLGVTEEEAIENALEVWVTALFFCKREGATS